MKLHIILTQKHLPQHSILEHHQPMFLPQRDWQNVTHNQTKRQEIYACYIFIVILSDNKREDNTF
jgi:hypothetical protein